MGRPAALPRDEILARLNVAFRRKGYDGTSLTDLAQATGMHKASLYHHFPGGKTEMAVAVLNRALEELAAEATAKLASVTEARDRVRVFAEVLEAYFGNGEQLCVMGSLAVSLARDEAAADLQRGFQSWIGSLARLLTALGCPRTEARRRAEEAVALFQGGLVVARGLGDPRVFRRLTQRMTDRLVADL